MKFEDLHGKSLRQLKAIYKDALNAREGKKQVAAEGGKRLPLAEVDEHRCGLLNGSDRQIFVWSISNKGLNKRNALVVKRSR